MVLLLRPTGLSDDPERKDWSVDDDGAVVGRICENLAVANPEAAVVLVSRAVPALGVL